MVALTATIYNFDIDLADSDRGVYETLALRVAQHPSESPDYLVTRVLAYCLEYADGIAFSKGLSDPDDPTIAVRDLTGAIRLWMDIGTPDAARLHKASKAAARVVVYTHKDPAQWLRQIAGERVHRAEALEIYRHSTSHLMAHAVSELFPETQVAIGPVKIGFGIMGGFNQAQAHAQFVSNVVDHGLDIQQALEAPRFTKKTFEGCDVEIEVGVPEPVRAELTALGHELQVQPARTGAFGSGQAVMRDGSGVHFGASEPRHDGAAIPEAPQVFG